MRRTLLALTCVTGLAALTACGNTPVRGVPNAFTPPATGELTPTASTSAPASSGPAPATGSRPRTIALDDIKPCELLTRDQVAQFHSDSAPRSGTDPSFHAPYCTWNNNESSRQLLMVLSDSFSSWTDGSREVTATSASPVDGFPAVTLTLPSQSYSCYVAVDTADKQYVLANFTDYSNGRGPKPCDGARQLAEAAMQSLTKK